jgi:hypothetical protein
MTIVLRNQVEASKRSVEELEAAVSSGEKDVALSLEVQNLLASLVLQLSDLNRQVRWWQDGSNPAGMPELLLEGFYRSLGVSFEKADRLCQAAEKTGSKVEGREEFLRAWRDLRNITCFSVESIRRAAQQFERRQTRTLGEVTRDLWDRPVV